MASPLHPTTHPASYPALLVLLLFLVILQPSSPSRILAVFPTVSKSHFDVFQPLLLALAFRGHDVTVVNSFPQPRVVGNYTDISLRDFTRVFFNDITFTMFPHVPATFIDNHLFLMSEIPETERPFTHPDVKNLLQQTGSFDLVLTELWNSDVFLGFSHKFKAPVIAMSSCTILPWGNARFGNPDNPSYIPNAFSPKMGKLNFWERLYNTYQLLSSKFLYRVFYNPKSERIARKMFGDSLPPLGELAKNTSMLFVNTHHVLHGPRPLSPQIIEIGGIHVKEPKALDQVFFSKIYQRLVLSVISETMAKTFFGLEFPSLEEIVKNSSLFLVNSHHTFYSPRPLPPQVVEVGGIHVRTPRPLNEELDKWMNESSSGVIYFSFGSMLRGATLPTQKVKAFVEVFRKLPQRVLWKWEDDTLEDLPENVKIMKWLPQRDVLAHPKVRVFISHGGLLGSTEAVVSGVPLLGIPMYGDQPNNVAALVDKGVAIYVDYNNITKTSLSWALQTLLTDTSYSDNARTLSRRFLDRPLSPLDTAVYWTEYVIRHGGAPHLRSAAVDLTWYQYYLLDVVAVCFTALGVILALVYYVIRFVLQLLGFVTPKKLKTA